MKGLELMVSVKCPPPSYFCAVPTHAGNSSSEGLEFESLASMDEPAVMAFFRRSMGWVFFQTSCLLENSASTPQGKTIYHLKELQSCLEKTMAIASRHPMGLRWLYSWGCFARTSRQ